MNATQKLRLVQLAVYSAGDTITHAEAVALIGGLFTEDPGERLNPARLSELRALTAVQRPHRRKRPS